MGEMATAIAHELSQPLAAIRNFLEGSVLRIKQSEALREQAGQIVWGLESAGRQVDHAATIIKSVREYVVRLEQSEGLIDLNAVLEEVRWFIEMKAAEGKVHLHIEPGTQPLVVSCEKVLIGQVILNLAFNAIEEMMAFPEGARHVRISTARSAGNALLTVADEGRGIDAGHRERLFDGFFSSKVSGNGIGLALCKNIIARHRGDIWAQPGESCGTRFCFTLPLVERHN
ncbi:hypothetical protein M3S_J72 [Sorghum bicolor]|nr:hypothetical protein M3S_J72 [Sorghum bicolor]